MQIRQSFLLAAAGVAVAQNAQTPSLTEVLASQNNTLSSLISLIQNNTAIASSISQLSNITVLAPNNDAIQKLLATTDADTAAMLAQPDFIQAVLSYHIINGTYYGSDFTDVAAFVPTALNNPAYTNVTSGQRVEVEAENGKVVITSGLKMTSNVVQANLNFTGGTLHIIDSVLTVPPPIGQTLVAENLTGLAGAVQAGNLDDAINSLQNVTVFAPSNDAFGAVASMAGSVSGDALASILKYHVVQGVIGYSTTLSNMSLTTLNGAQVNITVVGDNVWVNNARVIIPDVLVANGVVHVIDQVLMPDNTGGSGNTNPSTTSPAYPTGTSGGGAGGTGTGSAAPGATTTGAGGGPPTAGAAPLRNSGVVGAAALVGAAAAVFFMNM